MYCTDLDFKYVSSTQFDPTARRGSRTDSSNSVTRTQTHAYDPSTQGLSISISRVLASR